MKFLRDVLFPFFFFFFTSATIGLSRRRDKDETRQVSVKKRKKKKERKKKSTDVQMLRLTDNRGAWTDHRVHRGDNLRVRADHPLHTLSLNKLLMFFFVVAKLLRRINLTKKKRNRKKEWKERGRKKERGIETMVGVGVHWPPRESMERRNVWKVFIARKIAYTRAQRWAIHKVFRV